MNLDLFKLFWRHAYKGLIIYFSISLLLSYFVAWYWIVIFLIDVIISLFRFPERLKQIKKLKAKGLTQQDIINIEFTKKWGETRSYGIWRYCIRDGGIITGAGFSLASSLVFAVCFSSLFWKILSEPGSMFAYIGYSYLSGIITGIILFRILWVFKEKRFARLTDPLSTDFISNKISFDDLI
ncbi:hypothetical protein [Mucilaginibacter ginsenosidivorans]|uniref:Uncharacterized protein n=1 Tax=Mucilaginibacter ginsenosidivorans TaxID=398053 RepID=A0A5B8UZD6_9SPHI|nr:hypothetical protein [Mucilaginibacter ginsenosidivorans]QEC63676.1 hypothetical protein FRZ54_14180 [Mucilaginibacter ginsenosidivorans]